MEKSQIQAIKRILGYNFKRTKLVEGAVTYPSYDGRFEFLGRAIVHYYVSQDLYKRYPDLAAESLTQLVDANVCPENLARTAVKCGLHKFIRHNTPLLQQQIDTFIEQTGHSNGHLDPPEALTDTFLSLLGAVFVDSNNSYNAASKILKKLFKPLTETLHPQKIASSERERFILMGQAIINYYVSKEVFIRYPNLSAGSLTLLKGANVSQENLARIAVKNELHKFLRHNIPNFEQQVNTFIEQMGQYPIYSNGVLEPPKALSDCILSLIGAVFHDSNSYEAVRKSCKKVTEPLIKPEALGL